jgi:hypothetical protein
MKPMLFGSRTTAAMPDLAADPNVIIEQKLDGVRVMAELSPGKAVFTGAGGEPIRFAAAAQWFDRLADLLGAGPVSHTDSFALVLDGELMIEDGTYHVFDIPYARWARRCSASRRWRTCCAASCSTGRWANGWTACRPWPWSARPAPRTRRSP